MRKKSLQSFKDFMVLVTLMMCLSVGIYAAHLNNVPAKLVQPDGHVLEVLLSGDEYSRHYHDKAGYTIIKNNETRYYVYATQKNGKLVPTSFMPGIDNPAAKGLRKGLTDMAKWRKNVDAMKVPKHRAKHASNAPNTTGTINNIVVFISFDDQSEFTTNIADYEEIFNSSDPTKKSLRSYFLETSYNQLQIDSTFYPDLNGSSTVISYQDSHSLSYYLPKTETNTGGYDGMTERTTREHQLLADAATYVAQDVVDSGVNIDVDGDNTVDSIVFILQRPDGTPDSDILWPHWWALYSHDIKIGGKSVYGYNCYNSGTSHYAMSHEMFHTLGAPDLYEGPSVSTKIAPAARWDLMGWSSWSTEHMSTYMKWKYGKWIAEIPTITTSGSYTLNPATSSTNNCYRINSPYSSDEYFVLEFRKKSGLYENGLFNEGLLVWRVRPASGGNYNGAPYEAYVYRPNGTVSVEGDYNDAPLKGSGTTAINDSTNPASFLSDGSNGGLNISNVGVVGDTISFDVVIPAPIVYNTLTIQTSPDTGLTIGVSPADKNGETSGTSNFSRIFEEWTQVTVTAPATYAGMQFVEWTLDGQYWDAQLETSVILNADRTFVAHYEQTVCAALDSCDPQITWNDTGFDGWIVETDGTYCGGFTNGTSCASANYITGGQTSELSATVDGPGIITFDWVYNNSDTSYYLGFYIDGALKQEINSYSGWQEVQYHIPDGTHTILWRFASPTAEVGFSNNGAWVDNVRWDLTTTSHHNVGADFNGDGNADILWRNYSTGENVVWLKGTGSATPATMDNPNSSDESLSIGIAGDTNWYASGYGDFNGDQKDDILWRHNSDGRNAIWYMDGTTKIGSAMLDPTPDTLWVMPGTGDFNNDGQKDILWRHTVDGRNAVWLMNGSTRIGAAILGTTEDQNWGICGTGDFNKDGHCDILWRHKTNGKNAIWFMNGTTRTSSALLPTTPDGNWKMVGTGDYNNDGNVDIQWWDNTTGRTAIWYMNGITRTNGVGGQTVDNNIWSLEF